MKISIFITVISIFLSSCYTSSADKSEDLLFRGVKAYYNSKNEYMTRLIFEEVASRKETASSCQKAYANVYLAKLKLKKGDVESAIRLLDKAENICKNFPYKYELLRDFYMLHCKNDFAQKYNNLLAKWIENRIAQVDDGEFDVDKLEFINVRSCVNGEKEREFFPMYDLKENKEFRAQLYKKYLRNKLLNID